MTPLTAIPARVEEIRKRRKEIMRLMREDFDPAPPNWDGRRGEWNDNAEDVVDKIEALFALLLTQERARTVEECNRRIADAETALAIWDESRSSEYWERYALAPTAEAGKE